MNTQDQAYIEGFVKRAAEYGFSENEALELLKQSGIADAPAYQTNPTLSEGLNNVVGNMRKALRQPNSINPINVHLMTGSGGTPQKGIRGVPAMVKNVYSHLNPSGETPTIKNMNQRGNEMLSNMANGFWTTPVNR